MKIVIGNDVGDVVVESRDLKKGDDVHLCASLSAGSLLLKRRCVHDEIIHFTFRIKKRCVEYISVSSMAQICMRSNHGELYDGDSIAINNRTYRVGIVHSSLLKNIVRICSLCVLLIVALVAASHYSRWAGEAAGMAPEAAIVSDEVGIPKIVFEAARVDGVMLNLKRSWKQYRGYLDRRYDAVERHVETMADSPTSEAVDVNLCLAEHEENLEYARNDEMLNGCESALKIYGELLQKCESADEIHKNEIFQNIKRCEGVAK